MAVIDKYYEFVDKPSHEMSKGWKVLHIVLYTLAASAGILAHYMFSLLKTQFDDNCILFPNVTFTIINLSDQQITDNISNDTKIVIDSAKTTWGDDILCNYCEYAPVMSMILGCILVTFFIMCPRGGSRDSQSGIRRPWHIVVPTFLVTGVFVAFLATTSIITENGIEILCTEFVKDSNKTGCTNGVQDYIQVDEKFGNKTLAYIYTLSTFLYVMVLSWSLALCLVCCRCCCFVADFKLMEVTVSTVSDDNETNQEETEVLLEQNPTSSPVSHV